MEDRQQSTQQSHKLILNGRRTLQLTGVNDVLSFDANEVLLETAQGTLMVRGDELHVNNLSLEKGEVDVDGRIDSLAYSDTQKFNKSAGGMMKRLFG